MSEEKKIVGYRAAARVLNVGEHAVARRVRSEKDNPGPLFPEKEAAESGQIGYSWKSIQHLRDWFSSSPMPKRRRRSPYVNQDVEIVFDVFGASVMKEVERIQLSFNSPAMRLYRKTSGESEMMDVTEVLRMVVSVGLANWPEEG